MNILIADDDRFVRKVLRKIVEFDPKYLIREAVDGQDAWTALDEGYMPDLCLLDIEMPNMTGLELLRKMRSDSRFRDVPVLMVTSRTDVDSKATAASLSSYAFIIKPFNPKKVISLVKEAIDSNAKIFSPFGFEDRKIILEREDMDGSAYFKALVYFVEMLGLRINSIERYVDAGNFEQLLNVIQPLKALAEQVGGTLFLNYFEQIETAITDSRSEAIAIGRGAGYVRMVRSEFSALKDALETYLQVVIESDSRQKISTEADMTNWESDSIQLAAEIEEQFFDREGSFSLGNESIIIRGFCGDENIMKARLHVKDGRIFLSSIDGDSQGKNIDLSDFSPERVGLN